MDVLLYAHNAYNANSFKDWKLVSDGDFNRDNFSLSQATQAHL